MLAGAVAAMLISLSATDLLAFYRQDRGENWRDAARYVLADARPDDVVIFYPAYAYRPLDYYGRQLGVAGPAKVVGEPPAGTQHVWLLIRESDAAASRPMVDKLRASLAQRYHFVSRREFRLVGVELYDR